MNTDDVCGNCNPPRLLFVMKARGYVLKIYSSVEQVLGHKLVQFTYGSCLRSFLLWRRIWVELICWDAGLLGLIDYEMLGILGSEAVVRVASCLFGPLVPQLRRGR